MGSKIMAVTRTVDLPQRAQCRALGRQRCRDLRSSHLDIRLKCPSVGIAKNCDIVSASIDCRFRSDAASPTPNAIGL